MTKARDLASAIPAPSTVSSAELGYLDGVTSAIQTQVDAKIAKTLTTTTGDIIYASGANTPARLGIGSAADVLTVASGIPSWAAPAASGMTYSTWTPTYTGITIGNGTVIAKYAQSGKFVHIYFYFILGSTSSLGSDPRMTLPINLANARTVAGTLQLHNSGVAAYSGTVTANYSSSVTTINLYAYTSAGSGQMVECGSTSPFSFTTGDEMWFSIVYEGV